MVSALVSRLSAPSKTLYSHRSSLHPVMANLMLGVTVQLASIYMYFRLFKPNTLQQIRNPFQFLGSMGLYRDFFKKMPTFSMQILNIYRISQMSVHYKVTYVVHSSSLNLSLCRQGEAISLQVVTWCESYQPFSSLYMPRLYCIDCAGQQCRGWGERESMRRMFPRTLFPLCPSPRELLRRGKYHTQQYKHQCMQPQNPSLSRLLDTTSFAL